MSSLLIFIFFVLLISLNFGVLSFPFCFFFRFFSGTTHPLSSEFFLLLDFTIGLPSTSYLGASLLPNPTSPLSLPIIFLVSKTLLVCFSDVDLFLDSGVLNPVCRDSFSSPLWVAPPWELLNIKSLSCLSVWISLSKCVMSSPFSTYSCSYSLTKVSFSVCKFKFCSSSLWYSPKRSEKNWEFNFEILVIELWRFSFISANAWSLSFS